MQGRIILLCFAILANTATVGSYYQDEANLKQALLSDFTADESRSAAEREDFASRNAVHDDLLRKVLMDIYQETMGKWSLLDPDSREKKESKRIIEGVFAWLALCPDARTKPFFLEFTVSAGKDDFLRTTALASYLRVADAEETKKALIRFLVEGDRMDSQSRSTILWSTLMVYQDAAVEKRKAIVESLYAALAGEDTKWLFRVYDDILGQISPQYTHSLQRRDILARLIKAPALCKADDYAMPELEEKLRELKKTKLYTTISTNLSVLKNRDFNQPLPEEERIAFETPPDAVGAAQEEPRISLYALGGVAALALAAASVWICRKRRR